MNRHERRRFAKMAKQDGHEEAEITVCAGPPKCLLEGNEAVASAQAGCPQCRRIVIGTDGLEREYKTQPN